MAQQMVNGSHYEGSRTITNRQSYEYAVVNAPGCGKWRKSAAEARRRHTRNVKTAAENLFKGSTETRLKRKGVKRIG